MIIIVKGDIMKKNKCQRCAYEWVQRIEKKPLQCPACKSRYWNKKK